MDFRNWFEDRVILVDKIYTRLLKEDDIELLHQYRVNLRKLYACSEVYGKEIDAKSSKEFSKLIKKLLKPTALLRDLDLFLLDIKTLKCSDKLKNILYNMIVLKREMIFKTYRDRLKSDEYKNSIEILLFITKESEFFIYAVDIIEPDKIIADVQKKRELEFSRVNMHTPFRELHNLRKDFKKFRYALEIYEQCFSSDKSFSYDAKKLKRLQDLFGAIQDNYVRLNLLKSIEDNLFYDELLMLKSHYVIKLLSAKEELFKGENIEV